MYIALCAVDVGEVLVIRIMLSGFGTGDLEMRNSEYNCSKKEKWDLCNRILNMVRENAGLPLVSKYKNPYLKEELVNKN